MTTNAIAELSFDAQTRKRAQWEAFEFSVPIEGTVVVRNLSHADPDEHTYAVNVEDGVPASCVCSADQYRRGACKHRVAVAITAPVLEAATADKQEQENECEKEPIMADGGRVLEAEPQGSTEESGCPHGHPGCEGINARERPVLCFDCWEGWASQ